MKIPINIKLLPLTYHHWTNFKDLWFSAQGCVISLHCVKWNTNLNSYISCTVNAKHIKRCPLLVSGYVSLLLWQWRSNIYWHTSCWWAIWQSQVGLKLEGWEKVLVKKKIKPTRASVCLAFCSFVLTTTSSGNPGRKCERVRDRSMMYFWETTGR